MNKCSVPPSLPSVPETRAVSCTVWQITGLHLSHLTGTSLANKGVQRLFSAFSPFESVN